MTKTIAEILEKLQYLILFIETAHANILFMSTPTHATLDFLFSSPLVTFEVVNVTTWLKRSKKNNQE